MRLGDPDLLRLSRRAVVGGALVSGAALLAAAPATAGRQTAPASTLAFGPPQPFSWMALQERAKALAGQPYQPAAAQEAAALDALDFDAVGEIRYRPEAALWPDDTRIGPVQFFHVSKFVRTTAAIHAVEGETAREVLYNRALFDVPPSSPARRLPANLGFAGFRVLNPGSPADWVAFQGASYFRSADPFNQYGLSARALAINTVTAGLEEEFPSFTAFWLERADEGLIVYALLDGPSVAGAYRIAHHRGAQGLVQEIEAAVTFRRDVQRLGIAPMSSMFWYGADGRSRAGDWRPQIHDSDGLSLWTGRGERLWRPLANPPRVATHAFVDHDPKGFGLMQRDRVFADYQDDGAFYDRRPSVWVEPVGAWGAGSTQLVEIPTRQETDDNIVAFWTPAAPARAGDATTLRYRLHWGAEEPGTFGVARAVAMWTGAGGRPGLPPQPGLRKYVVDFEGGRLAGLGRDSGVVAVVGAGAAQASNVAAYPVVGARRWRLMFDIASATGKEIDLRAFLRLGGEALTETWIETEYG